MPVDDTSDDRLLRLGSLALLSSLFLLCCTRSIAQSFDVMRCQGSY